MTPQLHAYGTHPSEFMHIYKPSTSKRLGKLAVIYHGGFFKKKYDLSLMTKMTIDLAKAGYLVANVEYPRVGEEYTCPQMILSVYRSFDYACMIDPTITDRTVIGHSAGGYYAQMLGIRSVYTDTELETENPFIPTRVLSLAPLRDLWRGQQEGLSDEHDAIKRFIEGSALKLPRKKDRIFYDSYSPINAKPEDCPIHIIHGVLDDDVPLEHSQDYFHKYKKSEKVFLHILGNVNHYDVIDITKPVWKLTKSLIEY